MLKEKFLKEIQDKVPDGAEVYLFDHRKNLHDDTGEGSSSGIIRDFEIITHTAEDIEDGCLNVSAIHFDNDDYDEDGGAIFDKEWKIESVDRYWYRSSRNGSTYVETTFWYQPATLERKETTRKADDNYGDYYSLPEWAKSITENRKSLNDNRIY